MALKTISWADNKVIIIDQTKLPNQLKYLQIEDLKTLFESIRSMRIRGAPALAAAAACAVVLGIRKSKASDYPSFKKELERTVSYIGSSRPTAVNLFWGLRRMVKKAQLNRHRTVREIKDILFAESKAIMNEDSISCKKIARHGSRLIKKRDNILTICNL